jgi:hypothetical protein
MGIVLGRSLSLVSQCPRHPEVDQEHPTSLEPNNQILAPAFDGPDELTLELCGDLRRLDRARDAGVEDLDPLEPSPDEHRLEASAYGLDLWELRHAASVAALRPQARVSRMTLLGSGASSPSSYAASTSATAAAADASSRA